MTQITGGHFSLNEKSPCFLAMYPSSLSAFNVTRETKLATVLNIDNTNRAGKDIPVEEVRLDPASVPGLKNIDVNSWFLAAIYVNSNALKIGKVFNLPTFDEIDDIISREYPEVAQRKQLI